MQIVLIFLLQKSKNVKYLGRHRSHAISPVIDSLAPTFSYGCQKKKFCENGKQGNRGLGETYQISGNLLNYKMLELKDKFIRVQLYKRDSFAYALSTYNFKSHKYLNINIIYQIDFSI